MTASASSIVRGIRSDAIRDLARRAIAQGFDAGLSGRGHIRLVPPDGGKPVYMSATSNAGDWHELKRARADLIRVGFDPYFDPRRTRRLARHEPDVDRVADELMRPVVEAEPMASTPPTPPERPKAVVGPEHHSYRTGKTVFVTDETTTIAGVDVRIRARADGSLVGWTPPYGDMPSRLRTWSVSRGRVSKSEPDRTPGEQRAELYAKVEQWVADGKPAKKAVPGRGPRPKSGGQEDRVPTNGHVDELAASPAIDKPAPPSEVMTALTTPTPTPIRTAEPAEEDAGAHPVSWLTVRIEEAEYPLARALAELVDSVVPAIQALERSGRKAAADLLVESVEMSPAERELAMLWADIHGKPRLEHGRRSDD